MKHLLICLTLVLVSGCASYSSSFQKVELLLSQQKPAEALLELEQHPQTGKNELLYLLDKAMLQRMTGAYELSNQTFEKAKKLVDELDATSIIEQAGAVTINDGMMSYEGEDYEQVAIHLYAALNYIKLGLWDEARVEALQVDIRLKEIAQKNETEFEEDAFSRYLSGVIYEQLDEQDEAMIAYRKAYQTYTKQKQSVPAFLKHDLLRMSQFLGLKDEFQKLQQEFGIEKTASLKELSQQGEVLIIFHHSLAPIKRSDSVLVMGDKGVQHRISLPIYQSRPSYVNTVRLNVGASSVEANLVHDFDDIARRSFERKKPMMVARLIARTILKKAAAKNVENNNGSLAGLMVDVAGMVTETADTRSWLTLPKDIHFARFPVESGTYPASLSLIGLQGQLLQSIDLGEIEVKKGKITFLEHTYIRPYIKEN